MSTVGKYCIINGREVKIVIITVQKLAVVLTMEMNISTVI